MLKGNMLIAHGGGPTPVINSSLLGAVREAKKHPEIETVYGARFGAEGILAGDLIDLGAVPDEQLDLLARTPASAIGSCRRKLTDADYPAVLECFKKFNIRYFFYNGGNDSMDTCNKIYQLATQSGYELRVIGIPKTIDNDLAVTDHCPGFGSAAKYIAASTKEVIRDAMGLSYKRKMITIMEIMGRNAGWLTGATALAKTEDCCGPDLIYLPEIPFDVDRFLKKCSDLLEKKPSIVIAVSEGIKVPDGRYVCQLAGGSDYVDAFGHRQLAGTAGYLASFLAAKTGCKTRAVELSTLQRSASHMASRVDINEAFMVGGAAVKAADEGDSGRMVVIDRVSDDPYMSAAGIYDVHKIANNEKLVPRFWVNREGNYVTREFIDYVEPLIQGDYQPFMVNGLPQHLVLKR